MFYCENCNIQSESNRCPRCGRKNLREIQGEDFCFFMKMDAVGAENFKEILAQQNIPCALLPFGNGIRSKFGLKLESCLVFVPYKFLGTVTEWVKQENNRKQQVLIEEILRNKEKLHFQQNDEQRIIKKLRLPKITNLVDLCKSVVETATYASDRGQIYNDGIVTGASFEDYVSAHYYCVGNNDFVLWLNSVTWQVYKVTKA